MKTATIKARITPEVLRQLDTIVAASTGDRSDHIRAAIAEYITRHEPAPQPAPDADAS